MAGGGQVNLPSPRYSSAAESAGWHDGSGVNGAVRPGACGLDAAG
jgi:hypothetical protein